MDLSREDSRHLSHAIEIGRRGWGRVHPNPMVGCVIVKDGEVLAQAAHERFGGPHAEARALALAGSASRGATAYVSLEPCRHVGKTPPCAAALAQAGVARVVYWARDPGEREGGGGDWLRGRGVRVDGPFGSVEEWRGENPFFYHDRDTARPYVALKLAVSADGGLAPAGGRRVWLTGPEARQEVHRLRAGYQAILVGAGTWRADDPRLTVRGPLEPPEPPLRVFLDSRGEMDLGAAAFRDEGPILVAVAEESASGAAERFGDRAQVVPVSRGQGGLDLWALLRALMDRGVRTVLCEGGGRLATSLVRADVLDRIYLFHAPLLLGAGRVPAFPDLAPSEPSEESTALHGAAGTEPSRWRRLLPPETFGEDVLITLDRSR